MTIAACRCSQTKRQVTCNNLVQICIRLDAVGGSSRPKLKGKLFLATKDNKWKNKNVGFLFITMWRWGGEECWRRGGVVKTGRRGKIRIIIQ